VTGHQEQLILAVNPGATSTKLAVYSGENEQWSEDVRHEADRKWSSSFEQFEWRLNLIREKLTQKAVDLKSLSAVVGRGGPIAPMPSGTYLVDQELVNAIKDGKVIADHPSLLGPPLALALATEGGCKAYTVDPVSVDEFEDATRITGLPQIERRSLSHALNIKAMAREASKRLEKPLEQLNLIVLHLGSGFTVAAQKQGRQVDSTDASASGPIAPTRTGSLPALDFAKLCFSGQYTMKDIKKMLVGEGGWKAHLGTDDIREIYKRIDDGDDRAALVLDATLLSVAKETAAMAAVLDGTIDAIVISGGVARSQRFVDSLVAKLDWLGGTRIVVPGENEMKALAGGALRVLDGEIQSTSMMSYVNKFQEVKS